MSRAAELLIFLCAVPSLSAQQNRATLVEAVSLLEQAYHADALNYAKGYDLALLYLQAGKTDKSRGLILQLLNRDDKAELHNLLADVEEAEGHVDAAAKQYEFAARLDPSEKHLLDLGSDLNLHRGYEPALKVFQFAVQLYPQSAKLRVGLGVAYYSLGQYDEAVEALCQAVDIDPKDTRALDFLGKMIETSPRNAEEVTKRLAGFVAIYPDNAAASYYYALSLRKGTPSAAVNENESRAAEFLLRAIKLQPDFADAHYELGILYEEQGLRPAAMREYELAAQLRPAFAKAHYHLARLYQQSGRAALAKKEFQAFEALKAKP